VYKEKKMIVAGKQPGWNLYNQYQRTMELAEKMGFRIGHSQFGEQGEDQLGLWYNEDRYPVYNHEMQATSGDLYQISSFLRGLQWAKDYYEMIHLVSDQKIAGMMG
jgi:hypothetical protein